MGLRRRAFRLQHKSLRHDCEVTTEWHKSVSEIDLLQFQLPMAIPSTSEIELRRKALAERWRTTEQFHVSINRYRCQWYQWIISEYISGDDYIAPMRRRVARRQAVGGSQGEVVTTTSGIVGRAAEEWTTNAIRVTVTAVSALVGAALDADVGVVVDRRCLLAAIAGQIGRVVRWFACEVDSHLPACWMEDDEDEGGDDDATRNAWHCGVPTTLERRQRRPRRARRFPVHRASHMVSGTK